MYYQKKGNPIERRDHVFDVVTNIACILIMVIWIMTFLTIGVILLRIAWMIYVSIFETLQITLFMINKKIDLNI
jgi:hypothetical protein